MAKAIKTHFNIQVSDGYMVAAENYGEGFRLKTWKENDSGVEGFSLFLSLDDLNNVSKMLDSFAYLQGVK